MFLMVKEASTCELHDLILYLWLKASLKRCSRDPWPFLKDSQSDFASFMETTWKEIQAQVQGYKK